MAALRPSLRDESELGSGSGPIWELMKVFLSSNSSQANVGFGLDSSSHFDVMLWVLYYWSLAS